MTLSLSTFVRPFVCPFFSFSVFGVKGVSRKFKGISRKFQGCFKEVSRVFQGGSFKDVSRQFEGCFKEFQCFKVVLRAF